VTVRRDDPAVAVGGAALAIEGLEVRYGPARAIGNLSIEVQAGSLLAVLGPNGAGKSTLGRAVAGLVPSAAGRIVLDGIDIAGWPPHRVRRAGLAYIPEGRGIFPGLSVVDNLRMAVRPVGNRDARRDAIERAVELFPVLGERRHQLGGSLSGGEQQMLGLARALAVDPRVVIADEMSLGLAPRVVDHVFERIQEVHRSGVTVVLIEQFVHRALAIADHCVIMSRGTVGWSGTPADAGQEILDRYLGEEPTEAGAGGAATANP
jgi:ABC-type branched-subunit amino acid transport system ATPase component